MAKTANATLFKQVRQLAEIKAQIAELETAAKGIEAVIKAAMETRGVDVLNTPDYSVKWTEYIMRRVDVTGLKTENPAVYARYLVETPARRFTIGARVN